MSFLVGAIISSKGFGPLPIVLLTAALLIGLTIAYRNWREIHEEDEPVNNEERLAEFEKAHANGALDEAEYCRVTKLLRNPQGAERGATRPSLPPSKPAFPPSDPRGEAPPTARGKMLRNLSHLDRS